MMRMASDGSKIAILHGDPLVSAGLVAILQRVAGLDVHAYDEHASPSDIPMTDVVITDYRGAIRLAGGAVHGANDPLGGARILALTADDREADIRHAIKVGVHGYLVAGGCLDELVEAVRTLARGGRFICRSVAQRIAESMTCATLTRRECDVLRLVVAGKANKSIASILGIEVGTVKSHLSTILTKLGATSRTHAASIAAARGLLEGEIADERPPVRSERFRPLALAA